MKQITRNIYCRTEHDKVINSKWQEADQLVVLEVTVAEDQKSGAFIKQLLLQLSEDNLNPWQPKSGAKTTWPLQKKVPK